MEKEAGSRKNAARLRSFNKGDLGLMRDNINKKPGKHGKFYSLWLGPYIIESMAGPNSFYLSHLDGEKLPLPVNGQILKLFFKGNILCPLGIQVN